MGIHKALTAWLKPAHRVGVQGQDSKRTTAGSKASMHACSHPLTVSRTGMVAGSPEGAPRPGEAGEGLA